MQTIKTLR